jgi:ketosteroid isomerase-like protein
MGREELEVVQGMCEAFARGDWAAGVEPLHEDIEWDTTTMAIWPEAEVLHGRDAVLDFFRRFLGTWDDYWAEFEEYIDLGEHVVALIHDRGRGRGSGAEADRRFAQLWTVRDGAVVRFRAYSDREAAVRAAREET